MKTCIIDERISDKCERGLLREGFRVIKLPPCENAPAPLASHTDIVMFCHGERIIASADYCERYPYIFSDIREFTHHTSLTLTDERQGEEYPLDAIFNALTVGNKVFLKADSASSAVLEYAKEAGLELIHTRQGYPACTTLAFGENAVTADEGMARLLREHGINVLKIRNGGISLPPYEYGFIGGCSGVFDKKIYFLGDIMTHPDAEAIVSFIREAGYIPHSLSDGELVDLGGIFFAV